MDTRTRDNLAFAKLSLVELVQEFIHTREPSPCVSDKWQINGNSLILSVLDKKNNDLNIVFKPFLMVAEAYRHIGEIAHLAC